MSTGHKTKLRPSAAAPVDAAAAAAPPPEQLPQARGDAVVCGAEPPPPAWVMDGAAATRARCVMWDASAEQWLVLYACIAPSLSWPQAVIKSTSREGAVTVLVPVSPLTFSLDSKRWRALLSIGAPHVACARVTAPTSALALRLALDAARDAVEIYVEVRDARRAVLTCPRHSHDAPADLSGTSRRARAHPVADVVGPPDDRPPCSPSWRAPAPAPGVAGDDAGSGYESSTSARARRTARRDAGTEKRPRGAT